MPRQIPITPGQGSECTEGPSLMPVACVGTHPNFVQIHFPPGPALWKLSEVRHLNAPALEDLFIQDCTGCEVISAHRHPWVITGPEASSISVSNDGCSGVASWEFEWTKDPSDVSLLDLLKDATQAQRESQETGLIELRDKLLELSGLPQQLSLDKARIKVLSCERGTGTWEWLVGRWRRKLLAHGQTLHKLVAVPRTEPGVSPGPENTSGITGSQALPRTTVPEERIAFVGAAAYADTASCSPLTRLISAGRNYGNLIIGQSAEEITSCPSITERQPYLFTLEKSNPDLTIIRAANFLGPSFDWGNMTSSLERYDSRVAIMGLGSQSTVESDDPAEWAKHPIVLKEGTERFIRYIAKHCVSIGVRGEFTAFQLRLRGIENVRVIGCPSFYAKPLATLRALRSVPQIVSGEKILFSSTPSILRHPANREALLNFHRICIRAGADMIVQTETDILKARNLLRPHTASLAAVASMFDLPDAVSARGFASQRCHVFTNVDAWRTFCTSYGFSVGPRFHGNMAALQSGVPALFLTHDSRTRELTEALALPSCPISRVSPSFDAAAAYRDCVAKRSPADAYPERLRRFLAFLVENDIPVHANWLAEARLVAFETPS